MDDPDNPGRSPDGFLAPELLLSAIVESSDDAILSKNLNGIITSWNGSAQNMFGYTAQEMIGQPIFKLIPDHLQSEETEILRRLRNGEKVQHFETTRIRRDGTLINVSLTISPVRNHEGVIVGASKIVRDITELRKAQEQLREVALEAERQSRMKDEFLATLSHELRTPLQSILGWAHILQSEDCSPEELVLGLETIDRNAQAQTRIIEDLLDFNRILSGKVRLDVQRLSLAGVVQEALETVRPSALAREIRLQAIIDPLARPISGDPNRLQQIFWNLLSNAIKFTPRAGRVQIILERVNSHLEVSVSDNGQGIEPDFLPFVFDRFRQADASTTRRHGGLGLGLAIVKHLAELHGGSVRAKSAGVSQGATFTVCLPLAPVHIEEEDPQRRHPGGHRPAAEINLPLPRIDGARILVVDDEPDARFLIARTLIKAGAEVDMAGSVEAALTALGTTPPSLLISDIGMPDRDGFSLIRALRSHPDEKVRALPAIALTAYTRMEDRVRTLSEGFQMHLSKPVDALELLTVVKSLLR